MKKRFLLTGIFAALLFSSCATIVNGSKQTIRIYSQPAQATVFLNDIEVGQTPYETRLKRKGEYNVRIQLDGYLPYETRLTRKLHAIYFGNILLGGIVGLIIDPITGAMYKLTPEELKAELQSNETAFSNQKDSDIYVAVSLNIDENWEKIGQLDKQ